MAPDSLHLDVLGVAVEVPLLGRGLLEVDALRQTASSEVIRMLLPVLLGLVIVGT